MLFVTDNDPGLMIQKNTVILLHVKRFAHHGDIHQIFFQTFLGFITVSGPNLKTDMWGSLVEPLNQMR